MILEFAALVLSLIVLWMFFFKSKEDKMYDRFPGPKPYPLLGNLLDFDLSKEDHTDTLKRLSEQYGPVFLMRLGMPSTPFVCLSDPEDVQTVLVEYKVLNKPSWYEVLHPWVKTGLFTSTGDEWRKQRKLIAPAFNSSVINSFIPVFEKHSKLLLDKLDKLVGKEFDMMPIASEFSLDVILETAMGFKGDIQMNSKIFDAVKEITDIIAHRPYGIIDRSWLFYLTSKGRRHNELLSFLHGVTERIIKHRKEKRSLHGSSSKTVEGNKERKDFLDSLLDYNDDGAGLSDLDIRMQVDTFLTGGFDTSQSTISFVLYNLSQHPHVQDLAYKEIQEIFGDSDRDATYNDLLKMEYMDKVIKESMRYYSSPRFLGRMTGEEIKLKSGYTIPKNCGIVILIESMSHDPKLFPEPLKFDPERFANNLDNPFSYIPFGAGPRICIGQKYAFAEIKLLVSSILRKFRLLPSNVPLVLKFDFVLKSKTGIHLSVEYRKKM